jgi:hypothetical protein
MKRNTPLAVDHSERRIIYKCSVAQEHGQPEWLRSSIPLGRWDLRRATEQGDYTVHHQNCLPPVYVPPVVYKGNMLLSWGIGKLFVRSLSAA